MFEQVGKQISIQDINQMETMLKCKLPESFIKHYLKYNGGYPEKSYFYSEESDIETMIQFFSPIKYAPEGDENNTIEKSYILFKGMYERMKDYLPIASDYGANQICLNLKDFKIYMVYMDYEDVIDRSIKCLADTFEEFIEGLSDTSIEDDVDEEEEEE